MKGLVVGWNRLTDGVIGKGWPGFVQDRFCPCGCEGLLHEPQSRCKSLVSRILDDFALPVEKLGCLSLQDVPWVFTENIMCAGIGVLISQGPSPANTTVSAVEHQEVFENAGGGFFTRDGDAGRDEHVRNEKGFPIPDVGQGSRGEIAPLCSPCHLHHRVERSNDFPGFLLCCNALVSLIHEAFAVIRGSEDEIDVCVKTQVTDQPEAVSQKDFAAIGGMSVGHQIEHRRSLGPFPLGEQKVMEGG